MDRGLTPTRSCATCFGSCCSFEDVALSQQDLAKLEAAIGAEKVRATTSPLPPDPKRGPLHVATLHMKPQGARRVCVFLEKDGCSVYEHRPKVCVQYGVEHCEGVYERDPRKVDGRIRLRVL